MHPNALVEHATELLNRVMRFDKPADAVVSDYFREQRTLGQRERGTLAETVYTVLRKRLLYQHLATSGSGEGDRRLVLLGWRGNAGVLRAALSDTERSWLERVSAIDVATLPEKCRHNLPDWLVENLKPLLADEFSAWVDCVNSSAPLDLRVNSAKADRKDVQAELTAAGIEAVPTPYSPLGLRIDGKPALHKLDVFLRGDVEVQDEGSQLLALITGAKRGEMVVDFCAGAGGKTLALGAQMRNTGRLYAFDVSGHRLAALKPRLARSGLSNVYPVQLTSERDDRVHRLAHKIDRVLVDAPCSGLGTLRRNPDLKWRQSPQSVAEMRVKQGAILAAAAKLVKPGGRLVYATCSPLEMENDDVALEFSAANESTWQVMPVLDALTSARVEHASSLVDGYFLRLWPHRHATDGFFAAMWQKRPA